VRRFKIRHIRLGKAGEEHQSILTPTLIFPNVGGARYAFGRYCDDHLGPNDVADLIDDRGRVVDARRGHG
jgi:hypothetical protein